MSAAPAAKAAFERLNTAGLSTGLQAGAQTYGYAMFFMNDAAVASLDRLAGSFGSYSFVATFAATIVLVQLGVTLARRLPSRHPDRREQNNMWAYLILMLGSLVFSVTMLTLIAQVTLTTSRT